MVLLDEFTADDTDKGCVGSICYGSGTERFSCAGGAVQHDSLWRVDSEIDEPFGLW